MDDDPSDVDVDDENTEQKNRITCDAQYKYIGTQRGRGLRSLEAGHVNWGCALNDFWIMLNVGLSSQWMKTM